MEIITPVMTEDDLERDDDAPAAPRPTTVMERLSRMLAEAAEPSQRARLRDALLNGDFTVLFERERSAEE
jgi:hypothetical protein